MNGSQLKWEFVRCWIMIDYLFMTLLRKFGLVLGELYLASIRRLMWNQTFRPGASTGIYTCIYGLWKSKCVET